MANRDFRIRQGLMVGDSDLHFSLVGDTSLKLKTGATITIGDAAVAKAGDNIGIFTNDAGYLTASNVNQIIADNESDSTVIQALKTKQDIILSRLDSDSGVIQKHTGQIDTIHARLDSDHGLFQTKVAAGLLNLADSDLLTFQLDQKVAALIGRLDSDSIVQQTIRTQVYPRLDSDHNEIKVFKAETRARLDSDRARISALQAQVDAGTSGLRADLDSDSTKIQALQVAFDDLNTRAKLIDSDSVSNMIDSDFINSRLHFTENGVFAVDSEGELMVLTGSDTIDSVGNAITTLRQDRDSDSTKLQLLQGKQTDIIARLDSEDPRIAALRKEFITRLDSDQAVISSLVTASNLQKARLDSDDGQLQAVNTRVTDTLARLDSETARVSALQRVVDSLRADQDSDDSLKSKFSNNITLGVNAANTGGIIKIEPAVLTTTNTTIQTLVTRATSGFKGSKMLITAANTVSGENQVSEILLTHDGTNVAFVEYGIVYTGAIPLTTISADISGGSVRVRITSASAQSTTYKVVEQYTL